MANGSIQTAVLGVSGYAGMELARLLLHHPKLRTRPPMFFGREAEPVALAELHPQLADHNGNSSLWVEPFSLAVAKERGVELLFLATPHEQSRTCAPEALAAGLRVIDLSGAWRLQQESNRAVYNFHDIDGALAGRVQAASVYGMPELHRECIRKAQLVANPGCYATAVILGLKPLIGAGWVNLERGIVCDAKSGVSGAGKAPTAVTHFMHGADNLSAYSLFGHRHLGEIMEQLDLEEEEIVFTPHLLPIPRGIFATMYVTFREQKQAADVEALFREFYARSPMVRIFARDSITAGPSWDGQASGQAEKASDKIAHARRLNGPAVPLPEIQYCVRTNYCDIGIRMAKDKRRCIVVACLDNLLKGAAGQAVQNMNLMCGWNEAEGLA